jgi:hypothetical protein
VSLFSEGRRFRFGTIGKQQVIIVMTGLGMVHAYQALAHSVIEGSLLFANCCAGLVQITYPNGNI